ncbi:helix-turn-helix transcriptional regulator [Nocardia abscessus]|uniref:helix-turn-helix domain-containing protein n=1 Tax=Nocardia abscessus TaxID=120957 RepID=UPI00189474E7|nr:helix-turn-helix transcriptional regulator [Nocardia abscessus]MBF6221375.1 helix-turn-helix transcriptional regulator [Nocardia abscessus]
MLVTGQMLRDARVAANVSLREMSKRIMLDKGYLSRVETAPAGKAAPDWIVDRYEEQLGVDIRRRTLLGGLAGTVVPGLVTDAVRRMFEDDVMPIGIDAWTARMEQHAADCMTVGAAEMQSRIAADLIVLRPQLLSRQMWAIAARLMVLHGAPLSDVADGQATARWYRAAVTAADRSDDTATQVWVRGRSALNMAHPTAALSACEELAAAGSQISQASTVGRLMSLISLANVHALNGDESAARTALDDAQRVFDSVGTTDDVSDWAMPEWRMNVDISLVLARLGDQTADRAQQEAERTMPGRFARYATHLEMHRGLALAKSGDRTEGVAHARRALNDLSVDRHSVALRRLVAEVAACR